MSTNIHAVTPGEPITAAWANAIARHDHGAFVPVQDTTPSAGGTRSIAPQRTANDPTAWLAEWTGGKWCLQPGSIYVNGILIMGESSPVSPLHCSATGYANCWQAEGAPGWYIVGEIPIVDGAPDIGAAVFTVAPGEAPFTGWQPVYTDITGEDEDSIDNDSGQEQEPTLIKWQYGVQICGADGDKVRQYVCGDLWLTCPDARADKRPLSIVAGDGISVEQDDNVVTVSSNISFIPGDHIGITEDVDASTHTRTVTIYAHIEDAVQSASIVAGDGIAVHETPIYNQNGKQTGICYAVERNVSLIAGDGISITEHAGSNGAPHVVHIGCSISPFDGDSISFIAGDGINITESSNPHAVRIECTISPMPGDDLSEKVNDLDARVKALESKPACNCAEVLSQRISEMVYRALADVKIEIGANGVLENACLGRITFNTSGTYVQP